MFLFESTLANEISLVDSYKKTSSKCCNDPLRPPDLSGLIPGMMKTHVMLSVFFLFAAFTEGI